MMVEQSYQMIEVVRVRKSFVCYEEIWKSGSCSMKKIQFNGGLIVAKRVYMMLE
jgi:hypothetical protein